MFDNGDQVAVALLPAPAASAVYAALDLHARRPGRPTDVPVDARRADALIELVTARPAVSQPARAVGTASGGTVADSGARAVPARAAQTGEVAAGQPSLAPLVQVTVAASTLLGLDDQPADLAGHGPIPAGLARHLAADPTGTWRRILTDP